MYCLVNPFVGGGIFWRTFLPLVVFGVGWVFSAEFGNHQRPELRQVETPNFDRWKREGFFSGDLWGGCVKEPHIYIRRKNKGFSREAILTPKCTKNPKTFWHLSDDANGYHFVTLVF